MNNNFGNYTIPPTLQGLVDLQDALGDSEQFYFGLNFYLTLEGFRYFNTPSDVVVFGHIGVDGIHYGFLTDFGTVTDLEIAPIVCVCPMDFDNPTRIVAKNLREFLSVNRTDGELFYNQFDCEEDYLAVKEQWRVEGAYQLSENEKLVQERVITFLEDNLHIPPIERPYQYVQSIKQERQSKVIIPTQDGLGITTSLLQGEKHIPFPLQKHLDPNLERLQKYLYSAPIASRLALFRDIQLNYVLQDDQALNEIVLEAMKNMNLADEVKRLLEDV